MPPFKPAPPRPAWARSLRFQLIVWYTGALALILIVAALLVFLGMRRELLGQLDGFLETDARRAAAVALGRPGDPADPQEAVDAPPDPAPGSASRPGGLSGNMVCARLLTWPGRRVIAQSPALAQQPDLAASLDTLLGHSQALPRYAFAGPTEERMMRVYTLPVRLRAGDAVLQVAAPWDPDADLLEGLAALQLLGGAAALTLAAMGGWALVGRTLRPIGRIVAEAESRDPAAPPEPLSASVSESDGEIGHLIATLNEMMSRQRRAFETQTRFSEAQRRFAADASHELRTPLTILRGEMDLALKRPRSPEDYQATLASAVAEAARMSRIVEGLGLLARLDAGAMASGAYADTVDLRAIAERAVADFAPLAAERSLRLRFDCPADGPIWLCGNGDQLLQLTRNLLDNAVKYTPPGGSVTVEAATDAGQSVAVLSVRDTGVGIAPEDLPHVFERFWRADRSRSSDGTGLGLAICADIARAHGSALTAESELGLGSRFELRLPRQGIS